MGVSLPLDKQRLIQTILDQYVAKKAPSTKPATAQEMSNARNLMPQVDTQLKNAVKALAEEIISARKSGISAVEAANLAPSPVSADGKTGTLSKP